ncbi:hypothetical protein CR203_22620 [Salipaludibacillus neizhouensis]|uniref:Gfo/Idh/MocA-like oxidoreductase N-terminal domain-containing protein n=1 Tax=Salipaludibacillus neizhouensis TaxID=885475 RepID=A0A3A9KCG5_9BACI|nr:Gfo/Idh/MocA family oxidoreductase [Salipaludibacillus neizhouensis]RKL65065.1 hypothetical protein CR203_22620 [Salipaludibacillus neizhouensis]
MEQVRIGIIGVGNMGIAHASYLDQGEINGAVLTAILDHNKEQADSFVEKLNKDLQVFTDMVG